MQNLTYTQKRILDNLLPPLEKKIEDQEQLNRVCKVYRMAIEEERDPYLIQQFIICVESYLYRLLQRESKFYNSGYFKDNYKVLVNDFIEDNIDAVEDDFIADYINSQQEIIDRTFKRYINVEGYEALEVTQFVSKDFFDDFIRGSKKKIEFLKDLSKLKENAAETPKKTKPTKETKLALNQNELMYLFIKLGAKGIFTKTDKIHLARGIELLSDFSANKTREKGTNMNLTELENIKTILDGVSESLNADIIQSNETK